MNLTDPEGSASKTAEADSYANYLLCLSLDIGEEMLRSGAEVHRVEDTIERICHAYGAAHVEVFAITSLIVASVRMKDNDDSSQMRRISSSSYSFSCLEEFNAVSRRICRETPPLEEVDAMIRRAKEKRKYPLWLYLLGGCIVTGLFTFFFGGTWRDALIAALLGAVVVGLDQIPSIYLNQLAKLPVMSFITGCFAHMSVYFDLGDHADIIIIGTIMLMIPGLAFGNSLRDLLWGDQVAGIMRTVQACISAVLIAFGFMLAALLMGELGWLRETAAVTPLPWVQLASAALATAGYSLTFRTKAKYLPAVALCGLFTYAVYFATDRAGLSPFFAAFFAATFTTVFSEICARLMHAPSIIFSFAGLVPIVPGSGLYYAMDAMLFEKGALVYSHARWTLMVGGGIALGMAAVSLLINMTVRFRESKKKRCT